jgi:hypothetical protein
MSVGTTVAIVVVVIAVLTPIMVLVANAARRRRLQDRFGVEYDRVVAESPSRRTAESELAARQRRVRRFRLRGLAGAARETYQKRWTGVQERFVYDPPAAITDAQALVEAVMRDRGYPVSGYEQAVADLSVTHARTLDHLRSAHAASEKAAAGQATTEDLRVALLHYRELFGDLLGIVMRGDSHVGAA